MRLEKNESSNNELLTLSFLQDEENPVDFKLAIKNYMTDNYPSMSWQDFFSRLIEFRPGKCTLNMTP